MNKKFRILRIIGTLWKVLAWIELASGILLSVGVLLIGILGSGDLLLRLLGQDTASIPATMTMASSVVAFLAGLVITIVYFLVLYAVGELIYLVLAIEENTRGTMEWIQQASRPRTGGSSPPAVSS